MSTLFKRNKKLVITGGHLTPALAVIEEIKKRKKKWEIIFIGRKHAGLTDKTLSVEAELISKMGIPFFPLTAGKIPRHFNWATIVWLVRIPFGFLQAFCYLIRLRPRVVLSFGGYLSAPVVFSAWLLRIPVVTHEQTMVKGLATKFNSLFAQKIAVSWKEELKEFPSSKVVFTGNPVRREIFHSDEKFWETLGFEKELPLIFITGGNQGSHLINEVVGEIIPELLKIANVFHQCGHLKGTGDFEKLQKIKEKLKPDLKRRYQIKRYLRGEEMGTLLNKAHLVVSRAGANTVTELIILGKPAILIPLPWLYFNEQMKNAQFLARIGLGEILPQEKLSPPALLQLIKKMLRNLSFYQQNAPRAKKLVKKDAAKKILEIIEELAK